MILVISDRFRFFLYNKVAPAANFRSSGCLVPRGAKHATAAGNNYSSDKELAYGG